MERLLQAFPLPFNEVNPLGTSSDGIDALGVPFDIEQAQDWLAEAGFPNGDVLPDVLLLGWKHAQVGGPMQYGIWNVDAVAPFLRGQWRHHLGLANVEIATLPYDKLMAMGGETPSRIPAA